MVLEKSAPEERDLKGSDHGKIKNQKSPIGIPCMSGRPPWANHSKRDWGSSGLFVVRLCARRNRHSEACDVDQ